MRPLRTWIGALYMVLAAAKGFAGELSVLSFNAWFDDASGVKGRYPKIIGFLKDSKADILCLQEVTPVFFAMIKKEFAGSEYGIYGEIEQGYGVLTLSKLQAWGVKAIPLPGRMGREALKIAVFLDGQETVFYNVHLESMLEDAEIRFRQIRTILADANNTDFVIAGDFNFGDEDKESGLLAGYNDLGRTEKAVTYDVAKNPNASRTKFEGEPSRRLDKIVSSKAVAQKDFSLFRVDHSDHYPIRAAVFRERRGERK